MGSVWVPLVALLPVDLEVQGLEVVRVADGEAVEVEAREVGEVEVQEVDGVLVEVRELGLARIRMGLVRRGRRISKVVEIIWTFKSDYMFFAPERGEHFTSSACILGVK